jgi:hypothetical protein
MRIFLFAALGLSALFGDEYFFSGQYRDRIQREVQQAGDRFNGELARLVFSYSGPRR